MLVARKETRLVCAGINVPRSGGTKSGGHGTKDSRRPSSPTLSFYSFELARLCSVLDIIFCGKLCQLFRPCPEEEELMGKSGPCSV